MHPCPFAPGALGEHTSTPVQYSESSHTALLGVCVGKPVVQESMVHAIPSSGTIAVSGACAQPVIASQLSTVHEFASSQLTGVPPEQATFWQVWPMMHNDVEHADPSCKGV